MGKGGAPARRFEDTLELLHDHETGIELDLKPRVPAQDRQGRLLLLDRIPMNHLA